MFIVELLKKENNSGKNETAGISTGSLLTRTYVEFTGLRQGMKVVTLWSSLIYEGTSPGLIT